MGHHLEPGEGKGGERCRSQGVEGVGHRSQQLRVDGLERLVTEVHKEVVQQAVVRLLVEGELARVKIVHKGADVCAENLGEELNLVGERVSEVLDKEEHHLGQAFHGLVRERSISALGAALVHRQFNQNAEEPVSEVVALEEVGLLELRDEGGASLVVAHVDVEPLLQHFGHLVGQPGGVSVTRLVLGVDDDRRRQLGELVLVAMGAHVLEHLVDHVGLGVLGELSESVHRGSELLRGHPLVVEDAVLQKVQSKVNSGLVATRVHQLAKMHVEVGEIEEVRTHQPSRDLAVELELVLAVDHPGGQLLHQLSAARVDALEHGNQDLAHQSAGCLVKPAENLLRDTNGALVARRGLHHRMRDLTHQRSHLVVRRQHRQRRVGVAERCMVQLDQVRVATVQRLLRGARTRLHRDLGRDTLARLRERRRRDRGRDLGGRLRRAVGRCLSTRLVRSGGAALGRKRHGRLGGCGGRSALGA
mmetsp:Transcript_35025/g.79858  ORF Transcript_35025/g.79858 Transcript_35025/m.79858 type:complete len:475 (+) Transcript_35025:1549-2973(+)